MQSLFFSKKQGMAKRETSFTSQCTAQEIMSKIEEACGPLGFNVRKQNYKVCLIFFINGEHGIMFFTICIVYGISVLFTCLSFWTSR
jgi:hypothetical protein